MSDGSTMPKYLTDMSMMIYDGRTISHVVRSSFKSDVRGRPRFSPFEYVHQCLAASPGRGIGIMNMSRQRSHLFISEIHAFGCVQAADNKVCWYTYADNGDGERRERGIWRKICHAKYGLVALSAGTFCSGRTEIVPWQR
jgi:hypothetical protein